MPPNPQRKGSSGERELAAILMGWSAEVGVYLEIERNLEQVRKGGADLNGVPAMEIEVKRREKLSIPSWWRQVCKASEQSGKWPVLAYRGNRQPWRFRTYVHAAIYPKEGHGVTVPIIADMDETSFKSWFQTWVKQKQGED